MLITTNGDTIDTPPANGKTYTLLELQGMVHGYIRPIYLDTKILIVNEDGIPEGLPINERASRVAGMKIYGQAVLIARKQLQ